MIFAPILHQTSNRTRLQHQAWYELIADEMTLPLTVNSLVKACAKVAVLGTVGASPGDNGLEFTYLHLLDHIRFY